MADADLQISIGADASGVQKGATDASTAIGSIASSLHAIKSVADDTAKALTDALKAPNLDGVKSAVADLGAALFATGGAYGALAGAAMMAGVAVIDLAGRMGQGAQQTEDIAKKFGVSTEQAQSFQAIASLLGLSVGEVAQQAATGSTAFDQYNQILDQYGVRNADAVVKGLQLSAATREAAVAMDGFGSVMTEALAPALTVVVQGFNSWIQSLTQSYRQGGEMKGVVDGLVDVFKALVIAVVEVGTDIYYVFETIDGAGWMLAGVIQAMVDAVAGELRKGWDSFKTFGDVARDALTLNWGAIQNDIASGLKRVSADVVQTATQMGKDAAAGFQQGASEWAGSDKAMAATDQFEKTLWNGTPHAQANAGRAKSQSSGSGSVGQTDSGGGLSGGSSSPPIVDQQDFDALKQLQDILADVKETHNTSIQNMNTVELAFWQGALAHAKELGLTEDQITQITATVRNLSHTQAMQALEEEDEAAKRSAQQQVQAVDQALAATKRAIDEKLQATEDAEKRGEISRQTASERINQLIDQEVQAEQDAATKIAAAKMHADSVIMANNDSTTKAFKDALQEWIEAANIAQAAITRASSDGATKRSQLTQQEADQFKQKWDQAINPMVSTFITGVEGMLEGTKTFSQVWRGLAQDMLNVWIKNIETMVQQWLWKEVGQTLATRLGVETRSQAEAQGASQTMAVNGVAALKSITNSAAQAAAAAYKSMSGVPLVGNVLGAAAAAVAFAAVEAFGGLVASASGGYDIPAGANPLVQAHAEEMVLPASIARPLRGMIAANDAGANDGAGLGGGRGDTHHHYHYSISALDGQSVQRVLENNRSYHAAAMESLVRSRNGRGFGSA